MVLRKNFPSDLIEMNVKPLSFSIDSIKKTSISKTLWKPGLMSTNPEQLYHDP